ncbi:MAG TPA: hypothetical protein VG756_08390 [Pseudonocardiaceae bacterium]|jgi:hypothetical protein|nr:hypothetical protein [Pseudonocardiaceae bacterium]
MADRRIGGAGGGSDPGSGKGKSKGGVVIAAALFAGLAAAAGGADASGSIGAALDAAGSQSADAQRSSAEQPARDGDETEAWRRLGLKETKKWLEQRLRCAVQSYGQVQQFFLGTPCTSMDQRMVVLGDPHGNLIVVSVVWVKMGSASDADRLLKLENTYGTGDVTPVATEALELAGLRFTAQHYASRIDGSLVVIAETEPVHGNPAATLLNDAAKIAVLFPPP